MDFVAVVILLPIFIYNFLSERRKEQLRKAFDFRPSNAHGGARFATNDDLKRASLFRGKGLRIGYCPDRRRVLHHPGKATS